MGTGITIPTSSKRKQRSEQGYKSVDSNLYNGNQQYGLSCFNLPEKKNKNKWDL